MPTDVLNSKTVPAATSGRPQCDLAEIDLADPQHRRERRSRVARCTLPSLRGLATLAVSLVLWMFAANASAGILYDNLNALTYLPTGGFTISDADSPAGETLSHAEQFVPVLDGALDVIRVAIWHAQGSSGFQLLLTDESANLLESWTLAAPAPDLNTPVVTAISILNPVLIAGAQYRLTALAGAGTWDVWDNGPTSVLAGTGGFRVEGISSTPVPVPGSLTVSAIGLLCWLAERGCAKSRRSSRFSS